MEQCLEEEAERNKPEFMKARPKYYYYYEWMSERISQHCGSLPPCVVAKLLAMDATELDLLLTYPKAIKQQVLSLVEHAMFKCKDNRRAWCVYDENCMMIQR